MHKMHAIFLTGRGSDLLCYYEVGDRFKTRTYDVVLCIK